MPKSSIASETPSSFSFLSMPSVASVCFMTVDSVISSSSISAGRPVSSRVRATISTSLGSLNWRAEMFTATGMRLSTPIFTAQLQASRSACSPILRIRPVSSASWMNSIGGTSPRVGCFQRSSASCITVQPVFSSEIGW